MAIRFLFVLAVGLGMLGVMSAVAQPLPQPLELDPFPEPADVPRQMPSATVAAHAMVAAAHPLAAKTGVDILRAGGNAIDATVAVQMVLNVVEPQSSGIGGGSFILYYDAKAKHTFCIDGREETPAGARREDFLDEHGKTLADPMTGGISAGVPGTVAAMWLAHSRWGKLPIAQVLAPAIRLAEGGIGVTPRLRVSIAAHHRRLLLFPSSKAAFLEDGRLVPEIGTVLRQPDLGRTLHLLAEQGPKAFYTGEIAHDIVAAVRNAAVKPGHMSLGDLQAYRVIERQPTRFSYRGYEIVSMPPPSSGGIPLGLMPDILEPTKLQDLPPGSLEETDLLARVSNTAFADRNAYLGDQDWSPEIPMSALLDRQYIGSRRAVASKAAPGQLVPPGTLATTGTRPGAGSKTEGRNTTHFSIIDADRNVVSCTTTIENGMGCGLVVPGRGFLLNNQLTDFDLDRTEGPNALDASRRERKGVGGKRPRSSMTPVIVFKDGQPHLTAGSPGGPLIIGVVGQILVNVLDHGMDMQQAINAPRINSRNGPISVEVLHPHCAELQQALKAPGWSIERLSPGYEVWGGAHGIRIRPDGQLEGGADPRREGAARGY